MERVAGTVTGGCVIGVTTIDCGGGVVQTDGLCVRVVDTEVDSDWFWNGNQTLSAVEPNPTAC